MTKTRMRLARAVSFLVLPALAVAAAVALTFSPNGMRAGGERFVRIQASAFAFSPDTLAVDPGDHVTIELVSTDYVHGLRIDGYDVDITADPGQPASVSFIADRAGTYRIRCSVPCGPLHPFMTGRLQVGPQRGYWAALALAVLAILGGGLALSGQARPAAGSVTR